VDAHISLLNQISGNGRCGVCILAHGLNVDGTDSIHTSSCLLRVVHLFFRISSCVLPAPLELSEPASGGRSLCHDFTKARLEEMKLFTFASSHIMDLEITKSLKVLSLVQQWLVVRSWKSRLPALSSGRPASRHIR
jgi:hypothetical protein